MKLKHNQSKRVVLNIIAVFSILVILLILFVVVSRKHVAFFKEHPIDQLSQNVELTEKKIKFKELEKINLLEISKNSHNDDKIVQKNIADSCNLLESQLMNSINTLLKVNMVHSLTQLLHSITQAQRTLKKWEKKNDETNADKLITLPQNVDFPWITWQGHRDQDNFAIKFLMNGQDFKINEIKYFNITKEGLPIYQKNRSKLLQKYLGFELKNFLYDWSHDPLKEDGFWQVAMSMYNDTESVNLVWSEQEGIESCERK